MTTNYLRVLCVVAGLQGAALAQAGWTQVAATGPSARGFHAMVYDSLRSCTVLFGGAGIGGSNYLSDLWNWNGSSWGPAGGDSSRAGHAMAYDSQRGVTVLFGGYGGSSYLGDTREWNGSAWTQRSSTGPPGRSNHAMAYDSLRGRTVLFGGAGLGGFLGDTWEWDGSSWTQVATTGPLARNGHAMAYDSSRGRTVLFGCQSSSGILGDTWEWDGLIWTQVAAVGPPSRMYPAMVYDSQRGFTVLFGGIMSGNIRTNDTWEWNGSAWAQVAVAGPSSRTVHAMAYDSLHGRTVLFGGGGDTGYLGDTWEFNGAVPNAPATATSFGSGCGSPSLVLSPVANAFPRIATAAQASLTNIPSSLAFVALGWSSSFVGPFALPFPLIGYGMPGCFMLQSMEAAAQPVTLTGPGTATYSLPLPNWYGLLGLHLYLQGWAVAPGVNPGNTIVSNGLEWVIGY